MRQPNIVILGAGYGGLMTTVYLQKKLSKHQANITLINKYDYHYQTTWLHEAAAGTIHHDRVRLRIKNIINPHKVNFRVDTVVNIKPDEKKVILKNGTIDYDILVIGLGFEAATNGIPGLEKNSFKIGNIDSSRLLREHLEYHFALYNNESERNQARLNIVVGGGGLTGIELLGELANRVPELCEEYDINKARIRIIDIEQAPSILPSFDASLVEYARNSLEERGIELMTNATLKECKKESVIYEKEGIEKEIPTMTTVWATGARANSIVEESGFQTIRGQIEVSETLLSKEYDDVFVVGDCALLKNVISGEPYPQIAQIAVQQAKIVASNIKKMIKNNDELHHFTPHMLGTMVSLGCDDAMGRLKNGHKLYGWKAILVKKLIDNLYLLKLGGLNLMFKKGKFNVFY